MIEIINSGYNKRDTCISCNKNLHEVKVIIGSQSLWLCNSCLKDFISKTELIRIPYNLLFRYNKIKVFDLDKNLIVDKKEYKMFEADKDCYVIKSEYLEFLLEDTLTSLQDIVVYENEKMFSISDVARDRLMERIRQGLDKIEEVRKD